MATVQIPTVKVKSNKRRATIDQNSRKTTFDIIKNTSSIKGPIAVKPIKRDKQWQRIVTNDFRSFMLLKLIDTVYSVGDDFKYRVVFDERLQRVVEFFKKREFNIFKVAESRSEYLRLLADDAFDIQREIESKCKHHMEQHEKLSTLTSMVLDDLRKR